MDLQDRNIISGKEVWNQHTRDAWTMLGRNTVIETSTWHSNDYDELSKRFYAYIERDLDAQYGGNGYYDRFNAEYIGCYQRDTADGRLVFGGDTYINYCEKLDAYKAENHDGGQFITLSFACESTINTAYRTGEQFRNNLNVYLQEFSGVKIIDGEARTQDTDYYLYNTAYSIEDTIEKSYPKPMHFVPLTENDTRVIGSNLKLSDNVLDTWIIYQTSTFIDASKAFGPCNAIRTYKDRLFLFQDRGISIPSVNERVPLTIDSPLGFVMGTGGVLVRLDYISNHQGTRHQRSIIPTQHGLFFYDSNTKNILLVGSGLDSITETHGVKTKMIGNTDLLNRSDNPRTGVGINGFYDINNRELVYNFHDTEPYTLAFNSGIFNSYHDYNSSYYFTQNDKVYSVKETRAANEQEEVYQHNVGPILSFYGEQSYGLMHIVINKNFFSKKVFDGCMMNFHAYDQDGNHQFDDFFNEIRCWNDYQNSGSLTFVLKQPADLYSLPTQLFYARRDRTWSFYIPRNIVNDDVDTNPDIDTEIDPNRTYKERMKDKYLNIELVYRGSNRVTLPFIITKFRY